MQAEEDNQQNYQNEVEQQQHQDIQVQQPVLQNIPSQKPQLSEEKKQIIIRNQIFVFVLTFLAYAAIHSTRTAWSSSKQSLKEDLDEKDDHYLGLVDTCFLLCYAISMKLLGGYSSRFQIQYFLGFGMISASVCLLVIYFICQVSINKGFILFMMMMNGISQSSGWPSVVACMGNWFGNGKKGLLMGLWGTNGNVGNMIGYFVQDFAVNTLDLNWKFVLFIIGIFLLIIGSIITFNLEPYPSKLGITQADLDIFQELQQGQSEIGTKKAQKGDHIELNEEQDIEEKRNQTVVLEMPNKYRSFEDDQQDEHQQNQQQYEVKQNQNNHNENSENKNNNNHHQHHKSDDDTNYDNNQNNDLGKIEHLGQINNLQINMTESNSKEKIISSSPVKEKQNQISSKHDQEDEQNTSSSNNRNGQEIISNNFENNDSIKMNNEIDQNTSSQSQKHTIDLESIDRKQEENTETNIVSADEQNKKDEINLFNAWIKVPGLTTFALTQGGAKGTIYGLMFWLPIYLQEHGLKNQAAFICSMNEIGTFAGGLLLGVLIDKFKMKATIITLFLMISSLIMLIIHFLPSGIATPYFFFILLGGICLGGPYTMLGGAIAIDLAQQPEVRHYKNITALLAGIIEGFGSFVAAFVQIVIPFFGQKYIFLLFTFSCLFSSFFLMKKAIAEVKASPYYVYFRK